MLVIILSCHRVYTINFESNRFYYEYSRKEQETKIGLRREKRSFLKLIERLLISRLDTNDDFLKFLLALLARGFDCIG